MIQRNLFIKQKQTHGPGEQTYGFKRKDEGEEIIV